jgi:predicted kinase
MERADTVVRGGYTAITDAVFANSTDRDAVQHIAAAAGVPFFGLWLEAPESVLISRVAAREHDVSDAGVDELRRQLAQPLDSLRWRRVDASGSRAHVRDAVSAIVGGGNTRVAASVAAPAAGGDDGETFQPR